MSIQEIWRFIPGTTEYKISNLGQIKSLKCKKEKILKAYTEESGYKIISLRINNKYIRKRLHQWLAMAFIPNPNNLETVNHIDGDKTNNSLSNLEWCSQADNVKHAISIGRHPWINKNRKSISRGDNVHARIVLNLETGIYYECVRDASEASGIGYSYLRAQLNGGRENRTNMTYV